MKYSNLTMPAGNVAQLIWGCFLPAGWLGNAMMSGNGNNTRNISTPGPIRLFTKNSKTPIDINNFGCDDLIEHITSSHHQFSKQELPRIARLFRQIVGSAIGNGGALKKAADLFSAFADDYETNLAKQELILFPELRKLTMQLQQPGKKQDFEYGVYAVRGMIAENEKLGTDLNEIYKLAESAAPAWSASPFYHQLIASIEIFVLDFSRHNQIENNVLFAKFLSQCGMASK
jgi:regulator of cell morphogenesis and NO signaling